MKVTQYFQHVRMRSDRRTIKMEWIEQAVQQPDAERVQKQVQGGGAIAGGHAIATAAVVRECLLETGDELAQ